MDDGDVGALVVVVIFLLLLHIPILANRSESTLFSSTSLHWQHFDLYGITAILYKQSFIKKGTFLSHNTCL